MLKNIVPVLAAGGLIVALTACGGGNAGSSSTASPSSGPGAASQNGASITVAGSTALLPLVKQAAVDYESKHPNVKISVTGGGSMTGITQASQKGVDIGDSDVPAANQPELVDHRVAVVYFGVIVNPATNVKNLTTAQIRGVFTGKITNWKQVGGADQKITIINRPPSSGTRAVFVQKLLGGAQPLESGLTQDSSGTVAAMVAQTPGTASYVAMGYVKPGQQTAVSIDGVSPTPENVKSGKYPYWSYEHMLTNGQPNAATAAFIDFVKNDSALISSVHFIPVPAMKKG